MSGEMKYDSVARELSMALRRVLEAWDANNARLRRQLGLDAAHAEFRKELGYVRDATQRCRDAWTQLRLQVGELEETERDLNAHAEADFKASHPTRELRSMPRDAADESPTE